jgi:hypothetical protein
VTSCIYLGAYSVTSYIASSLVQKSGVILVSPQDEDVELFLYACLFGYLIGIWIQIAHWPSK